MERPLVVVLDDETRAYKGSRLLIQLDAEEPLPFTLHRWSRRTPTERFLRSGRILERL
jgi:hypothetical protein